MKRLCWIIGSILILSLVIAFAGLNQQIEARSPVVFTVENEVLSVDPDFNIKIVEEEEEGLDPNGKYIALTFDDGPSPSVTPRILEILKEHQAKATFFMVGSQVEYHPVLAKQVADEGHEIGNHTRSHSKLTKLPEEQMRQEIEGASQTIEKVIGQLPIYFRPPYGAYNDMVEKIAFENDSPIILWSVDSLDWKNRNAVAVKNLVLEEVFPGSIVLLHDIHPTTADALPALMTALKTEGYQFITVSELLTVQKAGEGSLASME